MNERTRQWIRMVAVLLAWLGAILPFALGANPRPPNIVFILADDQRYDELGHTGHPVMKTPNIDALARDGVSFARYFSTTAVCLPSRTTLITGQWERAHTVGFRGGRALSREQWRDAVFMQLKQAGYFTGLIGKSNIPGLRQSDVDYYCASDKTFIGFYPRERDPEFDVLFRGAKTTTQIEMIGEAAEDFLGLASHFHANAAAPMRRYLGRRPPDQPFFLYLGFEVPHGTGTRTMEQRPTDDALYRTTYRDQTDKMPFPSNYVSRADFRAPKLPLAIYNGEQSDSYSYRFTPAGVREQQVRTCQTISGIDRLVGRLRQQLEQLSVLENTIFIYTSDHGLMHGEWGYGGKCLLYEPSIHVPLIVHDPRPGAKRGVTRNELAVSPDVAPTILDLCGVTPPRSMQGRSLLPLLLGREVAWRKDFFGECLMLGQNYPLVQGVRGERWKYLRYWPIRPTPEDYREILNQGLNGEAPAFEELFDLQTDPTEQRNLAADTAHAIQLQTMRTRCVVLLRESLGREPEAPLPSATVKDWKMDMQAYYAEIPDAR